MPVPVIVPENADGETSMTLPSSTPTPSERTLDADLWILVCRGSVEAFEILVRRHQSLVAAVAYNACGDLALSEDVTQETFWAAWRERASLLDPGRLRPWLCGIARNLGKNAGRRAARPAESAALLDSVPESPADAPGPLEEAVSREEEAMVWKTLEAIPESYREPLILFYREGQSVAEVASALDLTEDAVKQRLSRGRGMLRDRMAEQVEAGLRRSRPGRRLTVAVISGLAAGASGMKGAVAAGVGAGAAPKVAVAPIAKGAVGLGLSGGLLGGLLGSAFGVAGQWFGTWLPAQLAPTTRERDEILRAGRRMLIVSVVMIGVLVALIWALAGRPMYLIGLGVWVATLQGYILVETIRLSRVVARIRAEAGPAPEPNQTALKARIDTLSARYLGRVYRSRATFFGLPLIDINVSDPRPIGGPNPPKFDPRIARGWVAIGDDARGLVLAIGGKARGLVAIGGRAVGGVCFGGVAFGVFAVGGLAVGVVALGGLAIGAFGLGGGAIGWQACGGGAIGWDFAAGGGAVSHHAAFGGGVFSYKYALGGGGAAPHFNDAAARAVILVHPLKRGFDWYAAHVHWVTVAVVLTGLAVAAGVNRLMYKRRPGVG